MQLWWEFEQSVEARAETAIYQDRKRRAFQRWWVEKYPEEAAEEYAKRDARLDTLVKKLLS